MSLMWHYTPHNRVEDGCHVPMTGVNSVPELGVLCAGSQIMAALGLCSETGDIQLLLSWLEARGASSSNSMMGLLLTGLDDLLCNTQAQDELNTLLEGMLKGDCTPCHQFVRHMGRQAWAKVCMVVLPVPVAATLAGAGGYTAVRHCTMAGIFS
jgi:hypothetical protein